MNESGQRNFHDKFKSCLGCPDRSVEPNYHMTCEGYLNRQERRAHAINLKKRDLTYTDFKIESVTRTNRRVKR